MINNRMNGAGPVLKSSRGHFGSITQIQWRHRQTLVELRSRYSATQHLGRIWHNHKFTVDDVDAMFTATNGITPTEISDDASSCLVNHIAGSC